MKINFSSLLLTLIFLLIITRPIIDLQGRYESGELNAGGIAGVLLIGCILVFLVINLKNIRLNLSLIFICLSIFLLISFYIINLIFTRENAILVDLFRFLSGFSPVLLFLVKDKVKNYIFKFNKPLLIIITISMAFPIIISWLQFLGLYEYSYFDYINGQEIGRPSGGYFQPSSLTRYLLFYVLILYIYRYNGLINIKLKYILLGVSLLTIFISTHRTSLLIGFIIVIMLELAMKEKKLYFRKVTLVVIPLVMIIGFIMIRYFIDTSEIFYIVTSTINRPGMFSPTDEYFLRGRGERWRDAINFIFEGSTVDKLIGIGYERFEPHIDVLRMILVSGFVGMLSFLILLIATLKFSLKEALKKRHMLLITLFVYFILFSIPLQPTGYPNFMMFFFFTILLIITDNEKIA